MWAVLVLAFSFTSSALAFRTVVIDAGHGGHDLGAADSYVYEKHINLDVARRLEVLLKGLGYKTVMVRSTDVFVPLSQRAAIANRYRDAVFISVHFNSSWKSSAIGIETYYHASNSINFARSVHSQLIRNTRAIDRGVKTAKFKVLRECRHPSILVEGGFVSNTRDRAAMMTPRYRQMVAESIAVGISNLKSRY